jgi:pilus assembly protein CpaB
MNLGRGWIWYVAGLLLAILAGLVAVFALRQAVPTAQPARQTTRPVIVASKAIVGRQIVTLDMLQTREMPLEDIPSGAVFRVEDAVGKLSLQDVQAGQPLLAQNLIAPASGSTTTITTTGALSALLPPDKVAVVLPAADLLSQSGTLIIGDHIDILASMVVAGPEGTGNGGQITLMHVQNAPIVKVLEEAQPATQGQPAPRPKVTGLVLAVDPQDGIILKYFIDLGAKMSIDLRSPKLTVGFTVSPVTLDYLGDKYQLRLPKPLQAR